MHRERQAILSLIALGRITPREGERLLAAWNAGRDELWIVGACVVIVLAQSLIPLAQVVQTFFSMHYVAATITYWIGGL